MKGNRMSTQFFNFRLFLEGLKRLRVIGLATAILALTASALVPIVFWLEEGHYPSEQFIDTQFLCVPLSVVTFLAPFFFFVLFSFLQKRKESDFFHSIPYTRTCVYVSFVAASLVFVWAIQVACALTAGILWSLPFYIRFDLGGLVSYTLICMLATAMLSSFMMLALSVSGTGSSCMLLFGLFTAFVRVVAAIFLGCLGDIQLLPINDMWQNSFFSPLWFLPLNILWYILESDMASAVMYSLPNVLYSILVTLAVYALAGFIYKHRKSEMAGNPAPGRKTQALFRIMFTLLPALLIPLFLANGADDASILLVLLVGVLLVYFLYELITTKHPKNMLKAVPGLGIVLLCCFAFSAVYFTCQRVVLLESISAEEIDTVSIKAGGMDEYTYQGLLLDDFKTDDPEIVQVIAQQLAYTQDVELTNIYPETGSWTRTVVTIRLDNGRKLTRRIMLESNENLQIIQKLQSLEETQEILYRLPALDEVIGGGVDLNITPHYSDYHHFYMDDTLETFMNIFREEFEALTIEQKDAVMMPTFNYAAWIRGEYQMTLGLRGYRNGKQFHNQYAITEDLPRTRAYLLSVWCEDLYNYYNGRNMGWSGNSLEILRIFRDDMDEGFFQSVDFVSVNVYAGSIDGGKKSDVHDINGIKIDSEKLPELISLLEKRDLLNGKETNQTGEKPGRYNAGKPITVSENTYVLRLMVEWGEHVYENDDGYVEKGTDEYEEAVTSEYDEKWVNSYCYLEITGLFDLTAEDWETILNLLRTETSKATS